jgi:ABC-type lipoprotein release transport system permease subunit
MLWKLAIRNLLNHRVQTLVVGAIIFFGTFISVIGSSLLDSISSGIRRSITQSIAGDAQIWSAEKDVAFSVFGDAQTNDFPEIGQIPQFPMVKKALLESIPNIKYVVPQGINLALLNPNTVLDRLLADLRQHPEMAPEARSDLQEHIRLVARDFGASYDKNSGGLLKISEEEKAATRAAVARATSDEFWAGFDADRNGSIEFLENKIAPLASNDVLSFFYYVGTTPEEMMKAFPLIEIVKGGPIPPGSRGFLFNEFVYERQIKHKVAVRLDAIAEAMRRDGVTIRQKRDLQQKVRENVAQAADVYNQISPRAVRKLLPELQRLLGLSTGELPELMAQFLAMDDSNFAERRTFFYEKIGPVITLYRMKVGDTFPLTAVSRTGSPNSVNVKLYGIFRFRSIENSPVSGYFSLMDLITFRQLYGHMTPERRAETAELEAEFASELSSEAGRDDVGAMFSQTVEERGAKEQGREPTKAMGKGAEANGPSTPPLALARRAGLEERLYSAAEMEDGVTPNAAVVFRDPAKERETIAAMRALFKKNGWNLKVEPWLEVSGALGQVAFVIRAILYLFLAVVYFVGAFIVANAVLMSMLQRTKEIGIIRAIGGQRSFVRRLVLSEVLLMSGIFGALGVGLALLVVAVLARIGIPAPNEILEFVFSGPKLILSVSFASVVVSYLVGIGVSLVATIYPLGKAVGVSPVTAMRAD